MLFAKEAATIAVAGGLCLICGGAVHADDGMPAIWRKWEPWAEIGGYAANHPDARRGETALWAPLVQGGDYLLFTDIRAKLFDEQQEEGNFALGYRQMLSSGWNLGIWASYDRRWSGTSKAFEQIAVGTEALSPNWDVRINGYIPLKDSKTLSSTISGSGATTLELVDDSLYFITAPQTRTDVTELAFWGIDAEVGLRVPLGTDLDRATDLRIFLGGYYFDNDRFAEPIMGPRLRAEWRINDILPDWRGSRLTFEASYSNDDARNDEIRAGASLRIPLGVATVAERELTQQELRMKEGLKRDTDIVTQVQTQVTAIPGSREHVEDTATGVDLVRAIIVSNGSNLQAAVDGVGENALIIAEGGATKFDVVALANNQTLLGGGGSIQVRGLNTGRLATYTAPGTQPTIFLPEGTDYQNITIGINTANNSHVSNFTLANIAPTPTDFIVGIRVGSNQTVVIDNMTFDRMQWSVNVLGTGANVTLHNSATSGTAEDIVIDGGANTIVADDNVFGANYKVVSIFNGENNLVLRNNTFAAGNVFHLFAFQNSAVYVQPGSTGNINLATPYPDYAYCGVLNATLFGSIEFTNRAPITQADCGALQ